MIIGLSGKKQSGKNTSCNFLAGEVLRNKVILYEGGLVSYYKVNDFGELVVPSQVSEDSMADGVLDLQSLNPDFLNWAGEYVFPHVKVYSFAFWLKWISVNIFQVNPQCVYGNDEQKNGPTHISRSVLKDFKVRKKILADEPEFLSGREFLQFLGTDVMRKIYARVWCDSLMNTILAEQSELSLVCDVRFPDEAECIKSNGGKVVRLLRDVSGSEHESEIALDDYSDFDFVLDNKELTVQEMGAQLIEYVNTLGVLHL